MFLFFYFALHCSFYNTSVSALPIKLTFCCCSEQRRYRQKPACVYIAHQLEHCDSYNDVSCRTLKTTRTRASFHCKSILRFFLRNLMSPKACTVCLDFYQAALGHRVLFFNACTRINKRYHPCSFNMTFTSCSHLGGCFCPVSFFLSDFFYFYCFFSVPTRPKVPKKVFHYIFVWTKRLKDG